MDRSSQLRNSQKDQLIIGLAQMAPVWLDRKFTREKMISFIEQAAARECKLVVFGEALLPGYPFWIERTDGARFNSAVQKEMHALYMDQAVQIEAGHLETLCRVAEQSKLAVYLGCIERAYDRGGHSLYCSLVFIDADGQIRSVHRKLMPTYEERLTWAIGDGHGLCVHPLPPFTVGGLNCWENWMPLARSALYGLGEDLHVAVWPGGAHNTADITRFIAKESRSYVLSASGLMKDSDFPKATPHRDKILASTHGFLANGGSCVAGPDGEWVIEPVLEKEELIVAVLDHHRVRQERQNFDPVGHYSRPDVLHLSLNRKRQSTLTVVDSGP
ncbi:MAG: carbon-nitrogen hydrolase family protein [Desulfobacteraceae bacterium]|nr:MAG: carbon-nitrogen hydrolase family protein [Desulfobacteraceae bacterium]